MDDRRLARRGDWVSEKSNRYQSFHLGTATTSANGGTLTRTGVYGQRFVLVATKCSVCGSVEVRVGNRVIGRVSLRGSYRDQVVIPLPLQARPVRGTLTIRVISTPGMVRIDGLGIGVR
jgi:hypothetical protein